MLQRVLELLLVVQILGGRPSQHLLAPWEYGEDTGVPRDRRRTMQGMALAGALAQARIGLPDGILQPLQQEL